jgi:hypothetical protein
VKHESILQDDFVLSGGQLISPGIGGERKVSTAKGNTWQVYLKIIQVDDGEKDDGSLRHSANIDEDMPRDRSGLRSLKSSMSAVFEFGDDEDNEEKMKNMNNEYFFLESEVNASLLGKL